MRTSTFLAQDHSLEDSEAVLFIYDHQSESLEGDMFLDQGMGANDQTSLTFGNSFSTYLFLPGL
jgi:hypothetical protein